MLVSSLGLVVVFMFAFVLAIDVNVGRPQVLEVAMVEPTWLGSASICEGEWGATQVMELCCHRGGGLPAVHGESLGKLEGKGLLTWAPVPSPFP